MKRMHSLSRLRLLLPALLGAAELGAGTAVATAPDPAPPFRTTVQVTHAPGVTIDNALNHPVWATLPGYKLRTYVDDIKWIGTAPDDGAVVKYLYNDDALFVRAVCRDRDVMTTGKGDQEHYYALGDVIEVFAKPRDGKYYWEIYGTPHGKFTIFSFPGRGRLLPSLFGPEICAQIPVRASVQGTLNDCSDIDHGWTVVICIPRKELEKNGLKFDKGSAWTLFVGRYDYSLYLDQPMLSSYPQITNNGGYHNTDYYADIDFIKK